ncbi:hypothetical protein BU15DRAFT_63302 [Melanogaster broomeanus]|nr:hypothetical protein BU15DRAFT_63302 [Melanogaster broomeanus]
MSLSIPEFAGLQTSKAGLHAFEHSLLCELTRLPYHDSISMVFDYLITIEDEVRWIWGRRWDITRLIFTVSRYVPFLGTGLTAYHIPFNSPSDPCPAALNTAAIAITGAEYKRVLYGLLAYAVVTICAAVAIETSMAEFLTDGEPPIGCLLESHRNVALMYAILLLYEIVGLSVRMGLQLTPEKAITVGNVVVIFCLSLEYSNLLDIDSVGKA